MISLLQKIMLWIAEQVKILVYVREGIDEWLLENGESMTLLVIFVLINAYM